MVNISGNVVLIIGSGGVSYNIYINMCMYHYITVMICDDDDDGDGDGGGDDADADADAVWMHYIYQDTGNWLNSHCILLQGLSTKLASQLRSVSISELSSCDMAP